MKRTLPVAAALAVVTCTVGLGAQPAGAATLPLPLPSVPLLSGTGPVPLPLPSAAPSPTGSLPPAPVPLPTPVTTPRVAPAPAAAGKSAAAGLPVRLVTLRHAASAVKAEHVGAVRELALAPALPQTGAGLPAWLSTYLARDAGPAPAVPSPQVSELRAVRATGVLPAAPASSPALATALAALLVAVTAGANLLSRRRLLPGT